MSSDGDLPDASVIKKINLSQLEKARAAKAKKRDERLAEEAMTQAKKTEAAQGANNPLDNDKAQEIVATYETISLAVMQLIANKWVQLNDNYVVAAKDIFAIQPHLEGLGGGGSFKVTARDPENLGNVLTRWMVHINKPPRPPARAVEPIPPPFMIDPWALPTGPAPMPQAPAPQPVQLPTATTHQDSMQYPPTPPPNLPPQYRSLPVDQQWNYYYQMQQSQQARTGIDAAAQVALSQVNALQSEKGQLMAALAAKDAALTAATKATEDKLDRLERDFQRQLDEAKEARKKAEADAVEARHRADMEARDARHKADMDARDAANREALAKITARLENGGAEKKSDDGGLVKWMPLALEWMRGNSSKDEAERTRALESQKLLIASMKREPGIEAEAMKHIVELLKSKADEKMANTESQIMMIRTISDFIKDQQGEEPPMWVGVANNFVEMLKGGMVGAAVQGVQIPGAPLPQNLEGGEAPGTTTVVDDSGLTADDRKALVQWQRFKGIDDAAAKMTYMAFQSPKMPPEFDTQEWRLLIFNLHRKLDPEKLAELTANHMEHLLEFGLISPQFRPVFEQPREMLAPVVMALPIAQIDKAYAEAFLETLVDEIEFRVTEKKKVEAEEAEEKAEAANGAAAAP